MEPLSVDVEVYKYERSDKNANYSKVNHDKFEASINDVHAYTLPMIVTERDEGGHALGYIVCKVVPSAATVTKQATKTEKKARSVVAKTVKNVATPAPTSTPTPARVPERDAFVEAFLSALDD